MLVEYDEIERMLNYEIFHFSENDVDEDSI